MSTTVARLIIELGYMLQEDVFETNGLWSTDEIIGYINTVCKDFVLRAQLLKSVLPVQSTTSQRIYDDPEMTMDVDRISFSGKPLYFTTRYMLDVDNQRWRTLAGLPKMYHQDQLPTKTFETDRAPAAVMTGAGYTVTLPATGRGGILRRMSGSFGYVGSNAGVSAGGVFRYNLGTIPYHSALIPTRHGGVLRQMLDGTTNFEVVATTLQVEVAVTTDFLPLPDFCKLYIKMGVLKKMLEKEGEGQDLVRAQYCGTRYSNGIALFKRLIYGERDKTVPTAGDSR